YIDIVAIADINILSSNQISILKNNGDGTFANQIPINISTAGSGIKLGDIDNDGDLDIVATSFSAWGGTPYVLIFSNDGNGNFNQCNSYSNITNNRIAAIADFNNDNKLDLLNLGFSADGYYSTNLFFFPGNGSLTFPNSSFISNTIDAERGPIGDINGDFNLDFIINRKLYNQIPYKIYLNDGNANFTLINGLSAYNNSEIHNLSDLDNDGDLDYPYITSDKKLCIAYNRNCYNLIPVIELGPDQVSCDGDSILLNAYTPCCTYLWNTGNTNATCNITATGLYSVTVTNSFGYSANDSVMITFNATPPEPIITQNGSILNSNAANGNQWYLNNTIISGATNQTYTPSVNGAYFVIVSLNGCSSDTSNIINFILGAATVTTQAATNVTPSSATLNGIVNANNYSASVTFDYGTTTSYGYNVNAIPGTVNGSTNTNVSYQLTGLSSNTTYHFRVNATNAYGTVHGSDMTFYTSPSGIIEEVNGENNVMIYPNPFAHTTTISYQLPEKSNVKLSVFDITGKEIKSLVNQTQQAGEYKINFNAGSLPSGIYYYRLIAGNNAETGKMMVITEK
ncbi:MAG: FG-GAP-like repeat-containing protein, partial [Bacteroidota bacterium]